MASDSIECSNRQMLIRLSYILACVILSISYVSGQLPSSNIYAFKIKRVGGNYKLSQPKFLTDFNPNGYNNQPHFVSDTEIYISTDYYGNEQTEIASLELFEKKLTRMTYTSESEYSPALIPGKDEYSCVRVESDGKTQSLSSYPKSAFSIAKRYLNNVSNVGYYSWMGEDSLALFLVSEPRHNLAIADIVSERKKVVLDNIGRTLKSPQSGLLYFIHKIDDDSWFIKEYNTRTNKVRLVCKTPGKTEDFDILSDGSIIMALESKLMVFNEKDDKEWKEIANLSLLNLNNIQRIAVRKGTLVLVNSGS